MESAGRKKSVDRLFTEEELKGYDCADLKPCYISILGEVFDVTEGRDKYVGGYMGFLGKDASRAYVTGEK